jgi:hypothetical protein
VLAFGDSHIRVAPSLNDHVWRNPSALHINAGCTPKHKLWAVVNELDELGSDVPDYLTLVKDGPSMAGQLIIA